MNNQEHTQQQALMWNETFRNKVRCYRLEAHINQFQIKTKAFDK